MSTIPARSTAGISTVAHERGHVVEEMQVPSCLLDERGALAAGAIGILADTALGRAVASAAEQPVWLATTHLHVALTTRPTPDQHRFVADGHLDAITGGRATAHGTITAADGTLVARASLGSVVLPSAPIGATRAEDGAPFASHPASCPTPTSVDELLGLEVLPCEGDETSAWFRSEPSLANSSGGLHGGVGFLVGARVLDVLARRSDDRMQTADLRAAFLRPIVANGRTSRIVAATLHRGRRLIASQAEIYDHADRRAVVVAATHVAA